MRTARRQKRRRRTVGTAQAAAIAAAAVPPMPFTPFSTAWMVDEAARWAAPYARLVDGLDPRFPHDPYEAEFRDEILECLCCCHEHTFGRGCPAYAAGACRGQGTEEARELYDWYRTTKPPGYRFADGFYNDDLVDYDTFDVDLDSYEFFDADDADREDRAFAEREACWRIRGNEERAIQAVFEQPCEAPRQMARARRRAGGATRATARRRLDRMICDEALAHRLDGLEGMDG